MAYRIGNREQLMMYPMNIEDMIPQDDPARVYDAFVESLDFDKLDFKMNFSKVGNPEYDPKAMLKVILYGYSYGERSSRRLERAINHNIAFIWLAGGLKPDHMTIARFRKRNKKLLKKVFKECAKLCIKLKLIAGNTLFVDGSKIRANAGINNTYNKETIEAYLAALDKRINAILNECSRADKQEDGMGSFVKLTEELNTVQKIKTKVKKVMAEMEAEGKKELNTTDPDCKKMKGRQGTHSSYNAQAVVDEKHGLIVSNEVVNDANDITQFSKQIDQANAILEHPCKTAVADAGYSNVSDLKNIVDQGIKVIVPNKKQAAHKKKSPTGFEKEYFRYNKEEDVYICPEGQRLKFDFFNRQKNHRVYQARGSICIACPHFNTCTTRRRGRRIIRLKEEEVKESLAAIYANKDNQETYKKRKEKVELVFGHIKHNLKSPSFLLRGLEGVNAEMAMFSTVFNIRRMITLLGPRQLIEAISKGIPCFRLTISSFLSKLSNYLKYLIGALLQLSCRPQIKTTVACTI